MPCLKCKFVFKIINAFYWLCGWHSQSGWNRFGWQSFCWSSRQWVPNSLFERPVSRAPHQFWAKQDKNFTQMSHASHPAQMHSNCVRGRKTLSRDLMSFPNSTLLFLPLLYPLREWFTGGEWRSDAVGAQTQNMLPFTRIALRHGEQRALIFLLSSSVV